nr:hypothetical protein [Blastocatellia bacterium]
VYNEPAGEYIVRSDRFWELRNKYKRLPIADEIAWAGAENPLPGECEGFVSCYFELLLNTKGRYLKYYPNGGNSGAAMKEVSDLLAAMEKDRVNGPSYEWPEHAEEAAFLNKTLTELGKIVAKVRQPEKQAAVSIIKKLRAAYKR